MKPLEEHDSATTSPSTLILARNDVEALLDMPSCIAAVEDAFRSLATGKTDRPGVLEAHVAEGSFHVKTASRTGRPARFAAKLNANFPSNRARFDLPTIQGIIALFDAECGRVLAVMDSIAITILRTAAATAVAARYLARPDARVVTICGCGAQSRAQLRALASVRALKEVRAYDLDRSRAEGFAKDMVRELAVDVSVARDLRAALATSDICVTCTPARGAFIHRDDIAPGTFIAAVGADSSAKQEIDPTLLAHATVVVDLLEQCAAIGDLHHALDAGAMARADVYAELGELAAGSKPGRTTSDEITIFDSTGTAIQDIAAAVLVYERATASGRGVLVALGA